MNTDTLYAIKPHYSILATTNDARTFFIHDSEFVGTEIFREKLAEACDLLGEEIKSLKNHSTPLTSEQRDKISISLHALFALHEIVRQTTDNVN